MTISYSGNFVKCLFRWKGSVWKAVWRDLLIWLFLYTILHIILAYSMVSHKDKIRRMINLFEEYTKKLPIEFLLGFYVGQVVKRWWEQVKLMPWPDDVLALINTYFHKNDSKIQYQRRLAGRYMIMSIVLALHSVSTHLKNKFPSYQKFLDCGLMTKEEESTLINVRSEQLRWDLPLQWVQHIIRSRVGLHVDDIPPAALAPITQELNKLRGSLRLLTTYNLIVLPLVYTQTVTVVVYGYFMLCFLGHQFLGTEDVDFFVLFLTILQFIFYVGWLKVAEVLHKPFGDDDDDVNLSFWLERHVMATYTMTEYVFDHPVDAMKVEMMTMNDQTVEAPKMKDWSFEGFASIFRDSPNENTLLIVKKK